MNKFIEVQRIVNKYDPMELIEIGCPKDEYEIEVHSIIREYERNNDFEVFRKKVTEIFKVNFEIKEGYDLSYLDKMIKEIFNLIINYD